MTEQWEVGPIAGETVVHLARTGNHAECKPYTQDDLTQAVAHVYLPARNPGFTNALANRMQQAHIAPELVCAECFTPEFRELYAEQVEAIARAYA